MLVIAVFDFFVTFEVLIDPTIKKVYGKHASIEVSPSGQVVQAYGPRNYKNCAT